MSNKGGMPGWLGFPLIGFGALMIWAGFNGVALTEVIASVLTGKPLPKPATSPAAVPSVLEGTAGASGAAGVRDAKAGDGVAAGGGGSW